jgi:hypothetical protein
MIVNLKTIEIRSITLKRCPPLGCAKIDNWRAAIAPTSASGVRRAKAALSSGCKPHPATAPAGSNRSSHGGNEVAEAFD